MMDTPLGERDASTRPAPATDSPPAADASPATPAVVPGQAFYYYKNIKIPLESTGRAVAKLKGGIRLDPDEQPRTFSAFPLGPEGVDPLTELAPSLRRNGLVVVRTDGPNALNMEEAAEEVEYVLPIVVAVTDTDAETRRTLMVMLPEISAKFTPEVTADQVTEYLGQFGLKIVSPREAPNAYRLQLAEGPINHTRVLEAANSLYERGTADKKVVYSHPSFVATKEAASQPTDPLYPKQWHLKNDGSLDGTAAGADINAEGAWTITTGKPEIRIAIVDDSVQGDHPDLTDNFVEGRFYDGFARTFSSDSSPRDATEEHGTACAGVAAARSNTLCGSGMAPNCGLVGVNIWSASSDQVADAFYYCNSKGASVISCSWRWGAVFQDVSDAIESLQPSGGAGRDGKGVVILFAAGNESGTVNANQAFGGMKEVICVGATDSRDDHSSYSNMGREVCVVAPSSGNNGRRITTSDNTDNLLRRLGRTYSGYSVGDCTESFGGTSSATPLVAGVCGLMLSANPYLTADNVREILEDTAKKVRGVNRIASYSGKDLRHKDGQDQYYGHGRVDAKKAVEAAKAHSSNPNR